MEKNGIVGQSAEGAGGLLATLEVRFPESVPGRGVGKNGDGREIIPRSTKTKDEFSECWPEIKLALAHGWPLKLIWGVLSERKKIHCSYGTLARMVAEMKEKMGLRGTTWELLDESQVDVRREVWARNAVFELEAAVKEVEAKMEMVKTALVATKAFLANAKKGVGEENREGRMEIDE